MSEKVKLLTARGALRVINIEDVKFDPAYQRGETAGVAKIMANFDKNALGVPLVGQREDGSLWCVDGRQRITAIKKLGWKMIRAEVFISTGVEHEAQVFKLVNANRTRLKPWELFKARLASGDKEAWAIKETVENIGLLIGDGSRNSAKSPNGWKFISAISLLENLVRRTKDKVKSFERLKRVLTVASEAWSEDKLALSHEIIGGLWSFYFKRSDGMVDDERLITRLRANQASKIIYSAGMLVGDKHSCIGQVIEKLYTKRAQKS